MSQAKFRTVIIMLTIAECITIAWSRQTFDVDLRYHYISVATDFICPSKGNFPHEVKCEQFYVCNLTDINGPATLWACHTNWLFHDEYNMCNYAFETHCGDRIRPDNADPTLEPPKTTTTQISTRYVPSSTERSSAFTEQTESTTEKTTTEITSKPPSSSSTEPIRTTEQATTSKPTWETSSSTAIATTTEIVTTTEVTSTTPHDDDIFNCTADGSFPHPKFCEKYFDCWQGKAVLQVCPDGFLFDAELLWCNFQNSTDCGQRIRPVHCPVDAHGIRYPDPDNCAGFFVCDNGVLSHFICPGDLVFNAELNVCDFKFNVDCSDRGNSSGSSDSTW